MPKSKLYWIVSEAHRGTDGWDGPYTEKQARQLLVQTAKLFPDTRWYLAVGVASALAEVGVKVIE